MTASLSTRSSVLARLSLALSLPFTLLFFVPAAGLVALLLAGLGTRYVRGRQFNDAGGWALLWLGGLILGCLGTAWTLFLLVTLWMGEWYLY